MEQEFYNQSRLSTGESATYLKVRSPMTSLKGHTYAKEGDELQGQVKFYRGGRAILSLDTDEEAMLVGTYPDIGSTVRVIVESADNPYEHMKRISRNITVVELPELRKTESVWRAPDSTANGPKATRVLRSDGSSVPVEYKRRRTLNRSTAA